jgi:hypothetical protein
VKVTGASADELAANSQDRGSAMCKDARHHHGLPLLARADEVIE